LIGFWFHYIYIKKLIYENSANFSEVFRILYSKLKVFRKIY
jgi:hypothetical protein